MRWYTSTASDRGIKRARPARVARSVRQAKLSLLILPLLLLLTCCLLPVDSLAQASNAMPISGGPIPTPFGPPASGAPLRVCLLAATGFPCSTSGVTLYSNPNLTGSPASNPTALDANGNYPPLFTAAGWYMVQITPTPGLTYTYYVNGTGGGGSGPVVQINSTPISPASPANFVNTSSVTWQFTGDQIEAFAGGLPVVFDQKNGSGQYDPAAQTQYFVMSNIQSTGTRQLLLPECDSTVNNYSIFFQFRPGIPGGQPVTIDWINDTVTNLYIDGVQQSPPAGPYSVGTFQAYCGGPTSAHVGWALSGPALKSGLCGPLANDSTSTQCGTDTLSLLSGTTSDLSGFGANAVSIINNSTFINGFGTNAGANTTGSSYIDGFGANAASNSSTCTDVAGVGDNSAANCATSTHIYGMGDSAGANVTGSDNITALGDNAGSNIGTGSSNILAFGELAGSVLGAGSDDIIGLGHCSAASLGAASSDVIQIGHNSQCGYSGTTYTDAIAIGFNTITASNQITIGDSSITQLKLFGCPANEVAYDDGSGTCVAPGGSGTVTDGAGTTSPGIIPESTASAHALDYLSGLSISAGVLGFSGSAFNVTGASAHGVTIPAGTQVAGAAGKVIFGSDPTNGYAEANENNAGWMRLCSIGNLQCLLSTNPALTGTLRMTASPAPTSSVGTLTGTNNAGLISGLSTAPSVTVTFASSGLWTTWVSCTANTNSTATNVAPTSVSTSAATFTFSANFTGTLYYRCDGD